MVHPWARRWGTSVPGTPLREGAAGHHVFLEGPRGETPGSPTVTMQLQRIAQQATCYAARVVNNVDHLIDRDFLREASRQTRKSRAPGMDQVTAQPYAGKLEATLQDLHERLRDHRYVAPPVERVWIEKEDGKQRPIGNPCFEDKIVQRAVVMSLEASFEPALQAFSQGCRKGHSHHQALRELRKQCRKLHSNWIVDAEVSGLFARLAWADCESLASSGSPMGEY